jgi:hypothetical protein
MLRMKITTAMRNPDCPDSPLVIVLALMDVCSFYKMIMEYLG